MLGFFTSIAASMLGGWLVAGSDTSEEVERDPRLEPISKREAGFVRLAALLSFAYAVASLSKDSLIGVAVQEFFALLVRIFAYIANGAKFLVRLLPGVA